MEYIEESVETIERVQISLNKNKTQALTGMQRVALCVIVQRQFF